MSQDIRNFFAAKKPSSSKPTPRTPLRSAITDERKCPITPTNRPAKSTDAQPQKRKRKVVVSSDEDSDPEALFDKKYIKQEKNIKPESKEPSRVNKSETKRKRVVIDSPTESAEPSPFMIVEKEPVKRPTGGVKAKPVVKPVVRESPRKKNAKPVEVVLSSDDSPNKKTKRPPAAEIAPSKLRKEKIKTVSAKLDQWVDKYKPTSVAKIVGQQTAQAPAQKLLKWLRDWPKHNMGAAGAVKKAKPTGFNQGDGSAFKAALLSGPPGIGKTTTAVLACEELGLRYKQMNASEARNKKQLEQQVEGLTHSQHVGDFFGKKSTKPAVEAKGGYKVKHVIIMDEVDGMSGNADRAGVAELIQLIKNSQIPIICICNDRQSQKIRSLANHCFDLRVQRPRKEQIMACLLQISAREKLAVDKTLAERIAVTSNNDIRQAIYALQLLAAGVDRAMPLAAKNIELGIFEAAHKMFSKETDFRKKRELFFSDYSMMPMFVQENYLAVRSTQLSSAEQLAATAKASDCICLGDMMSRAIRSTQNWSLLPTQGTMSCVLPTMYLGAGKGSDLDGFLTSQLAFPSWFGKNSTLNKRRRLVQELEQHMGLKMTGPLHAIATDYVPVLRNKLLQPLADCQQEGIEEVMGTYTWYDLVKDDMEAINEIGLTDPNRDISKKIESKTKAALTRALNKGHHKHHYALKDDVVVASRERGKKRAAASAAAVKLQAALQEDEDADNEEEEAVKEEDPEARAEILGAF